MISPSNHNTAYSEPSHAYHTYHKYRIQHFNGFQLNTVLVARLAAIEDMAGMSILCSDKTGTLTMNKMEIQDETPIYKVLKLLK